MPYAAVAVDVAAAGVDHVFDYLVPAELTPVIAVGQRVRVPFGRRSVLGWVVALPELAGIAAERLKPIESLADPEPILDRHLLDLGAWIAEHYLCRYVQAVRVLVPAALRDGRAHARTEERLYPTAQTPSTIARQAAWNVLRQHPGLTRSEVARRAGCSTGVVSALVREGSAEVRTAAVRRDPFAWLPLHPEAAVAPDLEEQQRGALAALSPALDAPQHAVFLLHGATGSGKTEVYLQAIARVLARGRQAAVLVPEISLTPQTVARFRARFGARVAVLHSGLSAGEQYDEWWRLRRGEVDVVVGARSAVFAPLSHPGLFVVDEEHEPSFKAEDVPRYHARAVALERARLAGIPVLLGSATPSLESFQSAQSGESHLLELPHRVLGRPLPAVSLVDLRDELTTGNRGVLSARLAAAIAARLGRGEQSILFLNRRGFATCVLCRECGFALRCQHCSVALAYHEADGLLHCHYCAARRRPPRTCPRCGSHLIRRLGAGTQRVEAAVREQFPQARVVRMDADTTGGKTAHVQIYESFRRGEADVLVGTQMVAKGFDLPGVTLVGVVNADVSLHLPDFRAAERTCQLLCQVAGRAGRGDVPGEVLVQTYAPEHHAITYARTHDYAAFARRELIERRELGYPPFGWLVRLVTAAATPGAAARAAHALAAAATVPGVEVLGPGAAPLAMLRDQHRWHLALKGTDAALLRETAREAVARADVDRAQVTLDVDPQSML